LIGGQGQGPAFLSFFDGACIGSPNKGTNHGADKLDCTHLEPAYGKRWCHELAAPLPYPWREMAKLLEGRAAEAHFGVCVLLCAHLATFCYLRHCLCRKNFGLFGLSLCLKFFLVNFCVGCLEAVLRKKNFRHKNFGPFFMKLPKLQGKCLVHTLVNH
jgi:hypothetical protein